MPNPEISADIIAAAERLMDVRYTDAERALMLDNIGAQIVLAAKRRGVALPADLAPAMRFDPRLPGWSAPDPGPFAPDAAPDVPLPGNDEDIAFAPVAELGSWIRRRRLTSARLTEIYLDRIRRLGPKLECIARTTEALAIAQAVRADRLIDEGRYLGPLHGIPYGAKDIFDTAGIVTGWGAEPYRDRVPERDAVVVRRLAEAGAVLVAKTTVGALAYGDIWYGGRTRNPWNTDEGSSGSSAGSAAATAAGLVGFAIGSETLGSIVAPSLRCGVTGLRPTFGRVPRTGAMPLCWSLDKIGPMCRSVEDTALVFAAIAGFDSGDASSVAEPFGYDAANPLAGLRLGYFPADIESPDAHPLDRAALDIARRLDVEVVPLERADLPYDALMNTLLAEAAAAFEELTLGDRDDELTWQSADAWPNAFRKARFLSAVDHVQLDRLRRRAMQEMETTFRRVDAIIGPPLAGPMLIITNFTGHPCLILRSGFRQSPARGPVSLARARLDPGGADGGAAHRVPHSVCVWGRLFDEGTILRIGRALERSFAVAQDRPPAV